jgi:hypothetical protein
MKSLALLFCLAMSLGTPAAKIPPVNSAETESALTMEIASIAAQYKDSKEIDMLAKLIYREARGVPGNTEKAAVVWCVLNRVDDRHYPQSIAKVITQRHQFAWRNNTPVRQEFKNLALDVVIRWELERRGYVNVGRVLPKGYIFFGGKNGHNRFRNKYRGGTRYNWSMASPYEVGVSAGTSGSDFSLMLPTGFPVTPVQVLPAA